MFEYIWLLHANPIEGLGVDVEAADGGLEYLRSRVEKSTCKGGGGREFEYPDRK